MVAFMALIVVLGGIAYLFSQYTKFNSENKSEDKDPKD